MSDNGSNFSLTDEHRISDGTYSCYITDYDNFNRNNFHSLHYIKNNGSNIAYCFPLTNGGTSPSKSVVMTTGFIDNPLGVQFQIRDNYNWLYNTAYNLQLIQYYGGVQPTYLSGIMKKENDKITYTSGEFQNVLSYDINLEFLDSYNQYFLNGYGIDMVPKDGKRIMGFGKAMTDAQMVRYMQILNTYIEETANAY